MLIKPKYGVNMRLRAKDVKNQWIFMQNADMKHDETYESIKGSIKQHTTNIGTNAPTAVMPYYDKYTGKKEVLVAVDDKIYGKQDGASEYTEIRSGLTPNLIRNHIGVGNKYYMASPADGLLEYDGASRIEVVNDIKLTDIISAKETNRCFGITKDHELAWTDDLVTMAGVPLDWNALNVTTIFETRGDVPKKLFMLNGRLVILMGNSIWVYYVNGSPSNWRAEKSPTVVGLVAPQTVRQVGEEIWFLGQSPDVGIGVFAFDGRTCRLLSYDIEPYLKRINPYRAELAVAETVDNIYKISFALDRDIENNTTFHIDTINVNRETGAPNIYGPHTYGFCASCVLNDGRHLFSRKHSDGARVFQVAEYDTQYSSENTDDGDLIRSILISAIVSSDEVDGVIYDDHWMKRYTNFYVGFVPTGNHACNVEILLGCENETFDSFSSYQEGDHPTLETVSLGKDLVEVQSAYDEPKLMNVLSNTIQLKVTNDNLNTRIKFTELQYDVRPVRRIKDAQITNIP